MTCWTRQPVSGDEAPFAYHLPTRIFDQVVLKIADHITNEVEPFPKRAPSFPPASRYAQYTASFISFGQFEILLSEKICCDILKIIPTDRYIL